MNYLLLVSAVVGGVACGEVTKAQIDAAVVIDGAIDAPPDAPPAPVLVTVLTPLADGAPDLTARVVFQDPQGALVLDTPVDALGKAQALLPLGGAVTVVRITFDTPTQHNADLTTITGVKPGDDLVFGLKQRATTLNQGGATQMTANFTPVSGATYYQLFHTCRDEFVTASPATLAFRDSCHGATFSLLSVAAGGPIVPPRFVYVANITHTNGASFTIPNGFVPMLDFTVNAINTPAEVTSMYSLRNSMIENVAVAQQSASVTGDPPAGAVSMVMPYPQGVGSRSQVEVNFSRTGSPNSIRHQARTATLTSSIEIDLAQHELPFLTVPMATSTGATWTALTTMDDADGQLILWNARWTVGSQARAIGWSVIGPASLTGQPLPRLPAALAAYDPAAQTVAVTVRTSTMYMADYDVVDGYDGLRQMPETLLDSTFATMGAFVGMPHQRRYFSMVLPAP